MNRSLYILATALFFVLTFFLQNIYSQNCANTSVSLTPINDLGTGYYRSYQGGLYPGGSNERPQIHNNAGLSFAGNIVPLDTAGNYNPSTGKIVLLSVGMSNCSLEFLEFMSMVNGAAYLNPKLTLVNGAQGGQTIDIIINPNAAFWTVITQRLAAAGLTAKQVQAVWFKEAQANPSDTAFPSYPDSLKTLFKTAMGVLKTKYINLKQCYLAGRIYGGYASSTLNPEPFAYYSGWSAKWLIEDQINGDPDLNYSGNNANSPWLSWGPYMWADGLVPRSDGLIWSCPADYNADGTHPSASGRQKVASALVDFFKTDEATKPWFLKTLTINVSTAIEGMLNPNTNRMRRSDTVRVFLRRAVFPFNVVDSASAVIDSSNLRGVYRFYDIPNGTYYVQLKHRNSIETWSRAGGEFYNFGAIYNYDFTNSIAKAYGNNLVLKGAKYCIYSGDIDQNGNIDLADAVIAYNSSSVFDTGYVPSDVNGNNIVDLSDLVIVLNNANKFIVKIVP